MTLTMNDSHMRSIAQIEQFLQVGAAFTFSGKSVKEKYAWIEHVLWRFSYFRLRKRDKSVVKQYIMKMTGYSDAQAGRLIARKRDCGRILVLNGKRHRFPKKYTPADVALLVEVDKAHARLNGNATKEILKREYGVYGKEKYKRISGISVSHIYNLRKTRQYRSKLGSFEKTKGVASSIGERRKPDNEGKPGYVRVDTVHQGDYVNNGEYKKGVYHINVVDEWSQWEVVGAVPKITERFLAPLLERLMDQFPFTIINFHSDNGSEYINHIVAALLNKLSVRQTKSRPRRSNDNGLAETKNGAVIRKHIGYAYIEQIHAKTINYFYRTYFNPYLNYHRPCAFPEAIPDKKKKGKIKKRYKTYLTPFERLRAHSEASKFLKKGVTIPLLQQFASQKSDTEAAKDMQKAKYELMKSIRKQRQTQS
jgi:hypothetical protein